jgi:hypothetical protein
MGIVQMNWPYYRDTVTVIDVLESGACVDGIRDWLAVIPIISGPTGLHVHNQYIANAANADGYGDGYGYGDGDGYGYGYGSGDGDGKF